MRNPMDLQIKRDLIDAALEASNDAEQKYGSGGWFREFSDFYEYFMGYGEL